MCTFHSLQHVISSEWFHTFVVLRHLDPRLRPIRTWKVFSEFVFPGLLNTGRWGGT